MPDPARHDPLRLEIHRNLLLVALQAACKSHGLPEQADHVRDRLVGAHSCAPLTYVAFVRKS